MNIKKIVYIVTGCIGVGLGAIGAVVPMIPAFPFLLLAAYCFGRSSEKLNSWFTGTKLYKDNLESYIQGKGMTKKTKVRIMVTVTILMSIGFIMMKQVAVGRIVLACVWLFHIIYFIWGVKTLPVEAVREEYGKEHTNEKRA
ncbi:MAG: YbaN family protein [Lachnospiraceae bacterium]|nr:YbaN family protein [Lachnospiraceae bacterium]